MIARQKGEYFLVVAVTKAVTFHLAALVHKLQRIRTKTEAAPQFFLVDLPSGKPVFVKHQSFQVIQAHPVSFGYL